MEEQRVWAIVEITSPRNEWASLGDAYRVNARFVLNETADTLRVPASAVFRSDGDRIADGREDANRNASLDAEVRDLKQGLEAIEERARSELGMIRHDEIFFQVLR